MSKFRVFLGMKALDVDVMKSGYTVSSSPDQPLTIERIGANVFSILHNGKSCKIIAHGNHGVFQVLAGALPLDVMVESERAQLLQRYAPAQSKASGRKEILAPMPALVAKVLVNVGDEIATGQGLVVLEAMKMENEIKAHQAGRVKEIKVTKGSTVTKGDLLIMLE